MDKLKTKRISVVFTDLDEISSLTIHCESDWTPKSMAEWVWAKCGWDLIDGGEHGGS